MVKPVLKYVNVEISIYIRINIIIYIYIYIKGTRRTRDQTHELGAGTIKEQAGNDLDMA